MSTLDIAREFFETLKAGARDRAGELLTDDVTFMCTEPTVTGRNDVFNAMTKQDGGLVHKIAWRAPEKRGEAICITGNAPEGAIKLGYIITLKFKGQQICLIQQQDIRDVRMAGSVRPLERPEPVKISSELKQMIKDARNTNPMLVSCVDETGQPILSFRGSIFAYADDQLAMWIRNPEGEFLGCIVNNPKVALMYRDQPRKQTLQFRGRARIASSPAQRAEIYAQINAAEQNHDFANVGVAVIVDIDMIQGYFNRAQGAIMVNQRREK
jgi:hypothetical protein